MFRRRKVVDSHQYSKLMRIKILLWLPVYVARQETTINIEYGPEFRENNHIIKLARES